MLKRSLLLSTAILALSSPLNAHAATDAQMQAMAKRIQLLEQELQLLKTQQETLAVNQKAQAETVAKIEPAAGAPAEGNLSVSLTEKGLEVKNGENDTLMRVRGYVQADNRSFINDEDENGDDEFEIRRSRLIVEGEVDDFYYRLSPDFGGSETRLYDAYAGYKQSDALDLRVGKFKPSTGLERLKSGTDTTFTEYAMPTLLTPNRDIGVQASGAVFDKKLSYQAGVFNGVEDDALLTSDSDDNKEFAGRLFAEPVKGIGFGVAGTWGEREGTAAAGDSLLPAYRTPGRLTFFRYSTGTFADGDAWRVIPQANIYRGPFSLLGEYAISAQEVRNGVNTADLENKAWGVQAGWVLTGEDASYKSISPENAFDPSAGHWGAWELAARYGQLDIDDDAFTGFTSAATSASEAQNAGVVLNGYLNNHVRVQVDYEHTSFEDGAAAGDDRETEQAIVSRVGVKF